MPETEKQEPLTGSSSEAKIIKTSLREALTEAHDWLDNGKCLWGGEDEFAALMEKIEAALVRCGTTGRGDLV